MLFHHSSVPRHNSTPLGELISFKYPADSTHSFSRLCHGLLSDQKNWLCEPLLLSCRSNFKLVAVNFKLYAIGGQAVSNVECYNPEQDAWNFVAPLPNPLAEFSACECKGKIYVIGGYTTRGKWRPGKWSSSMRALAAWGRTGGTGGSPLVHTSLMLCIAYCIFTYLEKRASFGTSKRGLWCLCMNMKIAWCGGSCEENMYFLLPALEIPPCSQPSVTWLDNSYLSLKCTLNPPCLTLEFSANASLQVFLFTFSLVFGHKHMGYRFQKFSSRLFRYHRRNKSTKSVLSWPAVGGGCAAY